MKKKILCLAVAVILTLGASVTAFAEEVTETGSVVFDGDKMTSDFSSTLAEKITELLPGDSVRFQISLKNTGSDDTDWYMRNQVLQTLEDNTTASGGAYSYELTYTDKAGNVTELYSSSTIGGESDSGVAAGLHQAGNSLEDYFYIGSLAKNETGSVSLIVGLDGETQGNSYQDTQAQLQLNFAVDKQTASSSGSSSKSKKKSSSTTTTSEVTAETSQQVALSSIRTGDNSRIVLFSVLALVCGIILVIAGIYSVNRERRRRKGDVGE